MSTNNTVSKAKEEKLRDKKIEQVTYRLGLAYVTYQIEINCLPVHLRLLIEKNDCDEEQLLHYRQSVLNNWNSICDKSGNLRLYNYDLEDCWPLQQKINNDNYIWMKKDDPMVSYLDVKRCCNEVGLNPSVYYQHCYQYKKQLESKGIDVTGIIKLFDTAYPDQVHQKLEQWISDTKVDNINMYKYEFPKYYIQSITPLIKHINKECQHLYYQYLSATADYDNPIDEPESCFEDSNYWRQARWGGNQMLLADGNNGMANALSQNEMWFNDGKVRDNPFTLTTNLVQILCSEHHVNYQRFAHYRNRYNQVLNQYGSNSDEFKSIDWNENHLII